MNIFELDRLHPGHVLKRVNINRIRICMSMKPCEFCDNKEFCKKIRHEKGSIYLFWECFSCYLDKLNKWK